MAKLTKFGTFSGVFTPSILTILGVIMYLRLPTIIGQAGLWATLAIIIIAHIISVTTGLSVSSIATDKKVQAGGTYYMISRSLGLSIGGTLGLALFVGLSFSVSLYIIGFAESFLGYWGWETSRTMIRGAGTLALLAVTIITLISTTLALRMQFVIMAAIILSLVSILVGQHTYDATAPALALPAAGGGVSLMVLFGIFFPAVTGFEAGVSMSGDLKDPKKSIPKGTIWAVTVGLVVYIALSCFLAYTVDADALAGDSQILLRIARVPELVVAGIWGATISSALGSILGAPRILQATAVDNITPGMFSRGVGAGNEPRNALLVTFVIAEAGILIGDLDIIARVVSIFFITTYGFLNLSAAFESWTSADFRPEFKIPIWVSVLGALACFVVMIQLDFLAMIGAIVILGLLYLYLKRRELALESGDTWSGIWASLVKAGLTRLNNEALHRRNWRPNVIMFSGSESERPHLVELGQAMAGRLGILSSFELSNAPEPQLTPATTQDDEIDTYFTHQYRTPDVYAGMDQIARLYGFSGVKPNTILMGWSKTEKHREQFAQLIDSFRESDYNTVFLNYDPTTGYGNHRTIDIWWRGSGRSLAFAISLIRHLTTHLLWKTAEPRLLLVLNDLTQSDRVRRTLLQLLDDYRMPMTVKLIDNSLETQSITELIANESARTDLTILGITEQKHQQTERSVAQIRALLDQLGTSLVISASSRFEEIDLGVNEKRNEIETVDLISEIRHLPALPSVRNEWLAQDIEKIDERNRQVLTTFYEQAFVPYFRENRLMAQELGKIYQSVMHPLQRDWEQYDEGVRRRRALVKATNDLYFQARALLDTVRTEYLETQRDALNAGIAWYFKRLSADVLRFPTVAIVEIPPAQLRTRSVDTTGVRWFKLRNRLRGLFSKRPPTRRVRYQQVASYYLRDNRYAFLEAMLQEWQEQSLEFFGEFRTAVTRMEQQIARWEKQLDRSPDELVEDFTSLQTSVQTMDDQQQRLQLRWLRRLQIEYRRNLRLMATTLETVDGPERLGRQRNAAKVYEAMKQRIASFPEEWHERARLQLNTISLDLLLQSTENRVAQEVHDFTRNAVQTIDKQFVGPLDTLSEQLTSPGEPTKKEKAVAYEAMDGVAFQKDLNETYEDVTKLVDQLPESLDVNYVQPGKEEAEVVRVPVQRLTSYWVETTLYLPLQVKVSEADQQLQRSSSVVRDVARLTQLQSESRATAEEQQAAQDAGKLIDDEKLKLTTLKTQLQASIDDHLRASFEKLSTDSFVTQSGDLGGLARAYQTQQVRTKLDQYQGRVRQLVRRVGTQLLYSKSQGILLAKRLTETEKDVQSPTARMLAFVEQATPSPTVIKALPFYYHTLFSGKSDISDDFWIPRPQEMALADQAIERLRRGYAGGILLLGERNSGKTALSWRMARRYTRKTDRVFPVYPTRAGSARISDFTRALRQATGKDGTPDQIIRALPTDSVLIINDLELWWERSPEGLVMVQELMRLISDYGTRCLFIVNINPTAYHLINLTYPIADYFLNVIPYQPFSTEEIERLVLLRHWSGGLTFLRDGREEDRLSEWSKVRFFNAFFDYSGGNPGVALGAWLASIDKVSGKQVHLRVPKPPDYDALRTLPDDWMMMIIQFLLHKRLSLPRLRRVLYSDMAQVRELLQDLLRAGLLVEKGTGVYQLNPYTEIHLINVLKEQEIL